MRFGLYIFASLVLIVATVALGYSVNPDFYLIEVMGIKINLPIAVWLAIPMAILFIFTLLHMFFHGLKNYFFIQKWKKDVKTLEDALYWSLVNEPKEKKYLIDEIRSISVILSKASLNIFDNVEGLNPRLARIANIINKIKNGEYIDLKENKLSKVFKAGNPILIQNRLNAIESDGKLVEDIMRSTSDYSKEVQEKAVNKFASTEDFIKARKYAKVFDNKSFFIMLNRVTSDNKLGLTVEILNEFIEALNLSCKDYVYMASITKKYFKPDENLQLFKVYQSKDEKAQNAYLYLLFEYELMEEVESFLEEHGESDFIKFRAFYELKTKSSRYNLEDIIDINSICNERRF